MGSTVGVLPPYTEATSRTSAPVRAASWASPEARKKPWSAREPSTPNPIARIIANTAPTMKTVRLPRWRRRRLGLTCPRSDTVEGAVELSSLIVDGEAQPAVGEVAGDLGP